MRGDEEIREEKEREWERDALSRKVIECVIRVHRTLGPGFLESIYHKALRMELRAQGLAAESEKRVQIKYRDVVVGRHRVDLIVGEKLIVEVKSVDELSQVHYAQVRSYLKAAGRRVALLVNFASSMADYRRVALA